MKLIFITAGIASGLIVGQLNAAPAPVPDTPTEIAACVVDNDAGDVKILLRTLPGSPAEAKAAVPVLQYYGGCDDNKAAQGSLAWRDRAEIANAALLKRIGDRAPDVGAAATETDWMLTLGKDKVAGKDYSQSGVGMRMLGDCIVRAAPQPAADLARAAPYSRAERAAIEQLSPTLGSCLPAGQSLRVKRADLRLVVAEPLYHLVSK